MNIMNLNDDHIKKYGETNKEAVEKVFGPIEDFRGFSTVATAAMNNTDSFLTVLLALAVVAYEKGLADGAVKA